MAASSRKRSRRKKRAVHKNSPVLVVPDKAEAARLQQVFAPLAPFDLHSIVRDAKARKITPSEHYAELCEQLITKLMKRAGRYNGSKVSWQEAFVLLALAKLGLGAITFRPRKTNKNAVRWDHRAESRLLGAVWKLREEDGLSERQAIAKIAKDREPSLNLPPPKRHRGSEEKSDGKAAFDALRIQFDRIKAKHAKSPSLMKVLSPNEPDDPLELLLQEVEMAPLLPRPSANKRKR